METRTIEVVDVSYRPSDRQIFCTVHRFQTNVEPSKPFIVSWNEDRCPSGFQRILGGVVFVDGGETWTQERSGAYCDMGPKGLLWSDSNPHGKLMLIAILPIGFLYDVDNIGRSKDSGPTPSRFKRFDERLAVFWELRPVDNEVRWDISPQSGTLQSGTPRIPVASRDVVSLNEQVTPPQDSIVSLYRPNVTWDLFISHAFDDKDDLVRPLADLLYQSGLKVWSDGFTLNTGGGFAGSVERGLTDSRNGLVILSPAFFHMEWKQKERDVLVARVCGSEKRILSVWHNVTLKDVLKFLPTLADKPGISTSNGLDQVTDEIMHILSAAGQVSTTPSKVVPSSRQIADSTTASNKYIALPAISPPLEDMPDPKTPTWDLFISHASEDKDEVARPLADLFIQAGLKVWYDDYTLTVGDSLRRSIDRGLAGSRFGLVIISLHFFEKEWPQKELDGLVAREDGSEKRILPVWHKVSRKEVAAFSPTLADKLGVSTAKGLDHVVREIMRVFRAGDGQASTMPSKVEPSHKPQGTVPTEKQSKSRLPEAKDDLIAGSKPSNTTGWLLEAARRIPTLNYAIGVVGLVAAAAISTGFVFGHWEYALFGGIAVFGGMILVRIYAASQPEAIKFNPSWPFQVVVWTCVVAFVLLVAMGIIKLGMNLFASPVPGF